VAASTGISAEVIAIDGKTSRRSFKKKGEDKPIHIVSAFAACQRGSVTSRLEIRLGCGCEACAEARLSTGCPFWYSMELQQTVETKE
jgi:hypothetical protein